VSRLERQDALAVVPGLVAMVLFVGHGLLEGGYPPTIWYPTAISMLALAAAVLLGTRRPSLPYPLALAVSFFGAFTLWGFVTIAWADDRAIALDGSAKTLLYFTGFAIFALLPWRRESATVVLSSFVLSTALAVSCLFLLPDIHEPSSRPFLFGRLADPIGYPNGNAALLLCAFWPAVVLASRAELHPILRAGLVTAAAGLLELVVATQSRGAAVAAAVTLGAVLLLVPGRIRVLVTLVPVAIATAVTASRFLELGRLDLTPAQMREAVSDARTGYLLSLGFVFVVGLAVAASERPLRVPLSRTGGRRVVVPLALGVAALVFVAGALSYSTLRDRIDAARSGVHTSRFSDRQVDGGRLELWRVGLDEFRSHPVQGIGVDNFAIPYARERKVKDEEPLYPHSLVVRILAQTGLVGVVLFVGFLGTVGWAVVQSARTAAETRAVVVAASLPALYWLVHGSIDWLWEIPGLSVPVLGLVAMAGRVGPAGRRVVELGRRGVFVAAGTCGVAAFLLVPLWLSARDVTLAGREWRDDPAAALAKLDRAATLNPLSDVPAATAGAIASRRGDFTAMAASYEDAVARGPDNWYSQLQLAVAYSNTGRPAAAQAAIRRARRLNPLEPVLVRVERDLRQGRRPNARELDAYFLRQVGDLIR
jgi:hypothetical protein